MTKRQLYYWFHVDGQNLGPLDAQQTRQQISAGRVTPDTWAWYEGLEQWRPVNQLDEILRFFPGDDESRGETRQAKVTAAEAQAPDDPALASFGDRLLAGTIDTLFLMVLSVGLLQLSGDLPVMLTGRAPVGSLYPFWLNALYALYFFVLMSPLGGGRTLGYRALHLHLYDQNTARVPGYGQTIIWYIGTWLLFVGWIFFFFDRRCRMLHNIVSRTIVVHDPD